MEYQIVIGKNDKDLTLKVQQLIALGWKPQGGVCPWVLGRFMQAMIR